MLSSVCYTCCCSVEAFGGSIEWSRLHQPDALVSAGEEGAATGTAEKSLHLCCLLRRLHQAHINFSWCKFPQTTQVGRLFRKGKDTDWKLTTELLNTRQQGRPLLNNTHLNQAAALDPMATDLNAHLILVSSKNTLPGLAIIVKSVFHRYQIVVEIIHATTISNLPQLKKQKGKRCLSLLISYQLPP